MESRCISGLHQTEAAGNKVGNARKQRVLQEISRQGQEDALRAQKKGLRSETPYAVAEF